VRRAVRVGAKVVTLRLPIALLVLATFAAPATAASARNHRLSFKGSYRGSGAYTVDLLSPTGEEGHVRAEFDWDVVFKRAPVRAQGANFRVDEKRSKGGGTWSITSGGECSSSGELKLTTGGGGLVDFNGPMADALFLPAQGDYSSTNSTGGGTACDGSHFWSDFVTGFSQIGAEDAVDPLTSSFQLRSSKLKDGGFASVATTNVIPEFPSLTPNPDCGFGVAGAGTCTQTFSWSGRVKIVEDR
jgi:hypothetical protein